MPLRLNPMNMNADKRNKQGHKTMSIHLIYMQINHFYLFRFAEMAWQTMEARFHWSSFSFASRLNSDDEKSFRKSNEGFFERQKKNPQ